MIANAIQRLGHELRCPPVARPRALHVPYGLLPRRWRSTLFAHKPGVNTRCICATMLVEAFQCVTTRCYHHAARLGGTDPPLCAQPAPVHAEGFRQLAVLRHHQAPVHRRRRHRGLPQAAMEPGAADPGNRGIGGGARSLNPSPAPPGRRWCRRRQRSWRAPIRYPHAPGCGPARNRDRSPDPGRAG